VGFVVDKVALGQVFPRVLRFSPVNFFPPVLHYTEKKTLIIFITGLQISLKAAVRPWHLLRGPSLQNPFLGTIIEFVAGIEIVLKMGLLDPNAS
jgi:hypothetical protein